MNSWVAVGACGPLSMNTSVADAVTDAIKPRQVLRGEVRRNIYLTIEYVTVDPYET
jgi:hypothetical protein